MTRDVNTSPDAVPAAGVSGVGLPVGGLGALDWTLEAACLVLLVSAAAVTVTQVFFRYVLNNSLPWPEEAAQWAFIWAMFIGMGLAVGRRSHIAIDLFARLVPPSSLPLHAVFVQALIAATSVMLLVHGLDLVRRSTYVSPALGLPYVYLYLAVPTGAALNLFYIGRGRIEGLRIPGGGIGVVLLGGLLYALVRFLAEALGAMAGSATILMCLGLALVLLQVPIAFALAFGAFAAFVPQGDLLLVTISQNMTAALNSFTLLAIPFFILAAGVMNVGGVTMRLVDVAARFVGHLRGGLGYVNVVTNTMMAGVSGSSMADAAAIAKVLVPEMDKRGYDRAFSCALTSSASTLANLIPPSLGLIIYGSLASASVGALFVATIVPGLLGAAALALAVHVMSVRRGYGRDIQKATGRERVAALWQALPALLLPVLIVGGVRFGIFTATEAGSVAVVYALVCGGFIYRQMTGRGLLGALRESLFDTVAVSVIIAAAAPFAWVLAVEQVPQRIAHGLGAAATNPYMLLLLINAFLLVVGLFMEMIAAMVILVPILIPIVTAVGVDPVHFGVVLVLNLVIGALTPPMGMLVFTTSRVGGANVSDVFRAILPFVLGLVATLMLVTYIPALSLTLVRYIGP